MTKSFLVFMKRREEASVAYVNSDVKPLADFSTRTSPATVFGPKSDYIQESEQVNEANSADAKSFK